MSSIAQTAVVVSQCAVPLTDRLVSLAYDSIPIAIALVVGIVSVFWNVSKRKQAEEALKKANADLEVRVEERTRELSQANEQLQREIASRQQIEVALRENQNQLQAILDHSPALIYLKDPQGRFILVNRRWTDLFHQEQVKGKSSYDFFSPEIADVLQANDRQVLQSGIAREFEEVVPQDDGLHTYLSVKFPLYDSEKDIAAVCGISADITERRWAEEELRQSEARFREVATREAILNRLVGQIRASLDLNLILETAVQEIRNLLQIDRCLFIWYRPHATPPVWEVVQEARNFAFPSLISYCVPVTAFGPLTKRVFEKEITRVDSARALTNPIERKFFFSLGYTALLALPIHTQYGEIGAVCCGHSSGSRPWREPEVELLRAVADSLAIAIDQAELYKQSRIAAHTAREQAAKLELALSELQQTQAQLVQSEKMSSLGQLVAGVAHEINNPVNFIYGNLTYTERYAKDLLSLVQLYQQHYPQSVEEIQALSAAIELEFIQEDLPKVLSSMEIGAERIRQIVLSLRNFSRLDQSEMKPVDIHEGLDNTLLLLQHRLKAKPNIPEIEIVKEYGDLPLVQCYAGQLNQVFMNILTNAIDALEESAVNGQRFVVSDTGDKTNPIIQIHTELLDTRQVSIRIADNGPGMTEDVQRRLFDPFFTTKPVGAGTGLGMSISYQIVERHGGQLICISAPGKGAEFYIQIPIHQ